MMHNVEMRPGYLARWIEFKMFRDLSQRFEAMNKRLEKIKAVRLTQMQHSRPISHQTLDLIASNEEFVTNYRNTLYMPKVEEETPCLEEQNHYPDRKIEDFTPVNADTV